MPERFVRRVSRAEIGDVLKQLFRSADQRLYSTVQDGDEYVVTVEKIEPRTEIR